jgi:hypothetical protein
LRKILALELALTSPAAELAESAVGRGSTSWRKGVLRDGDAPLPVLDLETLTEFDPRKCHYRGGQWTAP